MRTASGLMGPAPGPSVSAGEEAVSDSQTREGVREVVVDASRDHGFVELPITLAEAGEGGERIGASMIFVDSAARALARSGRWLGPGGYLHRRAPLGRI